VGSSSLIFIFFFIFKAAPRRVARALVPRQRSVASRCCVPGQWRFGAAAAGDGHHMLCTRWLLLWVERHVGDAAAAVFFLFSCLLARLLFLFSLFIFSSPPFLLFFTANTYIVDNSIFQLKIL
jgi:hypothetical protein